MRAPPVKRNNNAHDEEPGTKKIITGEMSDDDSNMKMDELNMINEKRTDEMIVSQAILGKNLHDVYSNERIILAVNRQSVENMNAQMASVDVMEVFSPSALAKLASSSGLSRVWPWTSRAVMISTSLPTAPSAGRPLNERSRRWLSAPRHARCSRGSRS